MDPRVIRLARQLLDYSMDLQAGERLLVEGEVGCEELVRGLLREARTRGADTFFEIVDPRVRRAQLLGASDSQLEMEARWRLARLEAMDARVFVLAGDNLSELGDVPPEITQRARAAMKPLLEEGLRKKWVVVRFPGAAAAQAAGMSTDAFEDFCFSVSTLDYGRMSTAMDSLVEALGSTSEVRVVGPGTDLRMRLEGLPVVKCDGRQNVPDGEVFTAPAPGSAEGVIAFNAPAVYDGVVCEGVTLTFREGRVIEATGVPADKVRSVLDTDEGARHIGELAFGVNPHILTPMKDVLYDEKIAGSLHIALGRAYEDADNGNRSAVHWDLVLLQTPEWGGGEVWFDGTLVRKDGLFVTPELAALNPERLVD